MLRADTGWADIDRDVKGNTQKSRITDDVIAMLAGMEEPTESYELLRERVMADLNLYKKSKDAQMLMWTKVTLPLPEGLEILKELLERPIEAPALTERERRLMSMLVMYPIILLMKRAN